MADQRQSAGGQEADRSHARTPHEPSGKQIESRASIYGKRYLLEPAPDHKLPKSGMSAEEAAGLIEEEMVLDGLPTHNLATFVTTWMEPEADRVIGDTLRVNFIDHAEYPQTAEIEQRCIRMLADLFHAPGETTGARTQGSSVALRDRRDQARTRRDRCAAPRRARPCREPSARQPLDASKLNRPRPGRSPRP